MQSKPIKQFFCDCIMAMGIVVSLVMMVIVAIHLLIY